MVVHEADFARGNACILKFHSRAFLAAKDNDGGSFNANGAGSLISLAFLHA